MSEATCSACSQPFTQMRSSGRPRKYCSERCKKQEFYRRQSERRQAVRAAACEPCRHCGGPIAPAIFGAVPVFCSQACRDRKLLVAYPPKHCALTTCGVLFVPTKKTQECCTEAHGKRRWKEVTPRGKDRMTDARRANLRRKTQKRRASLKGDASPESIDRDDIGDRDGWRCGLCDDEVDRSLMWPHPQSPSLDHIEPLSLGGKHVRSNVQIAHLYCNTAKGNRGGGEQLLLIG